MRKSHEEIFESEDIISKSEAPLHGLTSKETSELITEVGSGWSEAKFEVFKPTEFESVPLPKPKREFMKKPEYNHVWTLVLKFMKLKAVTLFQGVAKKFYYLLVPSILERETHNSLPNMSLSSYLFSKPRPVLTSTTVTHIVSLGIDKILVATDG